MEDTYTACIEKSTRYLILKYGHTAKVTKHRENQQHIGDQDKQIDLGENKSFRD